MTTTHTLLGSHCVAAPNLAGLGLKTARNEGWVVGWEDSVGLRVCVCEGSWGVLRERVKG